MWKANLLLLAWLVSLAWLLCLHHQFYSVSSLMLRSNRCPKPKKGYTNVHIVAHTHNDLGWLYTVDEYFYGVKLKSTFTGVKYILDSVIKALEVDPKRKFVYAETAFLWMWWRRQNASMRNRVRALVTEGRLEFVGGGWSMHDEAVTHYQCLLDQMSLGFRRLDEAFGQFATPRVGWQIDSFGHSSESASLMARFGFDGVFFARIDYHEKEQRLLNMSAEMIWEASPTLGTESDLFTSVFFDHYSSPKGFCFDKLCNLYEPITNDNADTKADTFVSKMQHQAKSYKSENILVPMGDDFYFQNASQNFENIQKLINVVNEGQSTHRVKVFFSTPSCYLKAVYNEHLTFPVKTGDFFPYSSGKFSYWTGYYTSRPTLKYFERLGNNVLQICKQLFSMAKLHRKHVAKLDSLREAVALLQHHDAITGTARQKVTLDYTMRLHRAITNCDELASSALSKLMKKKDVRTLLPKLALQSCLLLNISTCHVAETHDTFVITLYNPLSRRVSRHVRVPVLGDGLRYSVRDASGRVLMAQSVPIPGPVRRIPGYRSRATVELVFVAHGIPALGFKSYYVTAVGTGDYDVSEMTVPSIFEETDWSGSLPMFSNNLTKILTKINQEFLWYESSRARYPWKQSSGAYIFKPKGCPTVVNPSPEIKSYSGPVVDEVHQVFNEWVSQTIRLYKNSNAVEYHWMIGPIPTGYYVGKEVITRYSVANIASNKIFFTDSNGREMVKRVRDQRPDYNIKLEEPVAGNYYPITTRITIKDGKRQVSVITDRAQGGTSLTDSQIEIMLHRRCLCDDKEGVGEPLNERAYGAGLVVRGTHYVTFGKPRSQSAADRMLIQEKVMGTWTFFTATGMSFDQWRNTYNMEYSGLRKDLPPNVQILTLEPWKDESYLIRLEHIMEKDDNSLLSKPVTVDLKKIFVPFEIKSIEEMTLGGDQRLMDSVRLVWNKDGCRKPHRRIIKIPVAVEFSVVKLKAMQIRSFIVHLTFK